jgi:hypothetical protein
MGKNKFEEYSKAPAAEKGEKKAPAKSKKKKAKKKK